MRLVNVWQVTIVQVARQIQPISMTWYVQPVVFVLWVLTIPFLVVRELIRMSAAMILASLVHQGRIVWRARRRQWIVQWVTIVLF